MKNTLLICLCLASSVAIAQVHLNSVKINQQRVQTRLLELIETLNENNIVNEHPLELIIFANEEGSTVGSGAIIGKISPAALKSITQSGLTIADGIRAIGGNPDSLSRMIRKKGRHQSFPQRIFERGRYREWDQCTVANATGNRQRTVTDDNRPVIRIKRLNSLRS